MKIVRNSFGNVSRFVTASFSMVKNEQDVIESFIRHNLNFVDFMVIADNRSTDATREILQRCAKEFPQLIVLDKLSLKYDQSEYVTNAFRSIQEVVFADFLIPLDADEFILSSNRTAFEQSLEAIPVLSQGIIPWKTFLPGPEAETRSFPECMTLVRKKEMPTYAKSIYRADTKPIGDIVFTQGAHVVVHANGSEIPMVALRDCALQHFPIRSAEQLKSKAVVSWIANLAHEANRAEPKRAFQWKKLYDFIVAGETYKITDDLVATLAVNYAQTTENADFRANCRGCSPFILGQRTLSSGLAQDALTSVSKAWADSMLGDVEESMREFVQPPDQNARSGSSGIERAFDNQWHWQNLLVDFAPFKMMAERFLPQSVLDVGCGSGIYLKILQSLTDGEVFGVDGVERSSTMLNEGEFQTVNLEQDLDFGRRYDLVVCLEVLEHLKPEMAYKSLDLIERSARERIVFSAAELGQPGHGHINCRPIEFWLDAWAERGWYPNLYDTLALRAASNFSWFRRNIIVLDKNVPETDTAKNFLVSVAGRGFRHPDQERGIFPAAFANKFPPEMGGYIN